ncbi:MAG: FKBP-type peptidyl-prolyl cis-trans isomerase [Marinobacterium sp.]|nr:FKBP-type peptidyl-prolyl cis-trans isomerase [Marinobacterium sp.]
MKRTWLAAALATTMTVAAPVFAAESDTRKQDTIKLETEEQKLSYSLGLILGQQLSSQVETLDYEAFQSALKSVYNDLKPALTEEQIGKVMQDFQARKMAEQREALKALADTNLAKGEAYQAENAKKEGVLKTESGLQYEVLVEGEGKQPGTEDTVKVHYTGTLVDGTMFDSSVERGEPVSFQLNGVIPGWTEGLQLMKEGGKARFVIPSDLAYGPGGMGKAIGPNETLVFEVELLKVNPED